MQVSEGNQQCGDGGNVDEQNTSNQGCPDGEGDKGESPTEAEQEMTGDNDGIDPSILRDVEIEIVDNKKWDGDGTEPVDNIPEGPPSEQEEDEDHETLEAAEIICSIEQTHGENTENVIIDGDGTKGEDPCESGSQIPDVKDGNYSKL